MKLDLCTGGLHAGSASGGLCVLTMPAQGLAGWNAGTSWNATGDADSGLACTAKAMAGKADAARTPIANPRMVLLIRPTPHIRFLPQNYLRGLF